MPRMASASESILFVWGKGAGTRRKILHVIHACGTNKSCFLTKIAQDLGISHVAVRKHVQILLREGYIEEINPGGKPVYLTLSEKGKRIVKRYKP